jgi:hypothetical protein
MGLQRIFLSLLLLIVGQDAGAETIEITRSYWFKEPLPWEAAFRHSTGGRGREKESIERFRFMETLRVEHEGKRRTFSQVYLRDHGDVYYYSREHGRVKAEYNKTMCPRSSPLSLRMSLRSTRMTSVNLPNAGMNSSFTRDTMMRFRFRESSSV